MIVLKKEKKKSAVSKLLRYAGRYKASSKDRKSVV